MRRARRTARLILLLAIITPLLAASILWPASSATSPFFFPSTIEPRRALPLEAMKAIAEGSRPASDLFHHINRFGIPSRLSTDTIKVFVFRQRERAGDELVRTFGAPLPCAVWFKQTRSDNVPTFLRTGIFRSLAMIPFSSGWLWISFGPAALTICVCVVLSYSMRQMNLKRWSLPVVAVLFLVLSLWPHRSQYPIYVASMSVIPSWAVGALPDKQGFPYPRTDAEVRAITAEVVSVTERVGTTPLDGDFEIYAEISGARPTHIGYGILFPILQHTALTSTTPFPPHRTAARLSWHTFDLQLPNSATATQRHILSLDIPALAQLILLFILAYHTIRLIHYRIQKRRHHKRLKQNLCPLCAYPAPKPA